MRRESGSAATVIVILILLLAAGAYYFFYMKDKPAEPGTAQAEQEETTADDSGEPKAHERIRANYKEKLNKRIENIPE
jgi:flagellar basal body-associated protein FliL